MPDTELDRWIVGSVLDFFGRADSDNPHDGDLLSHMRSQLGAAEMDPANEDVVLAILERVSEYMAAGPEMKTRSPGEPVQPGAEAGRALTLFELRPKPETVQSWAPDELNLGWRPYALAIFIAGFAAGYSDLATWQRGGPELRYIVEAVIADSVNGSLGSDVPRYLRAETISVKAERPTFRESLRLTVRYGNDSLLSRELPPLSTRAALLKDGIADDQLVEDASQLAQAFDLHDPVTWQTVIEKSVEFSESEERRIDVVSRGRKPTIAHNVKSEDVRVFLEELCGVDALEVEESLRWSSVESDSVN